MSDIKYLIQKELKRVFSDRKLIFSLFILPAVLMMGIMTLSSQLSMKKENDINEHIPEVYVINEPNGFEEFVREQGINANIKRLQSDAEVEGVKLKIIEGDAELLYVFERGFLERVDNYQKEAKKPIIEEYYNPSKDYSVKAQANFSAILMQLEHSILVKRLGSEEVLTAFTISTTPILNEEKATGELLGQLIPYFVSVLIFAGAMGLAIDAFAGEKERGTLASMLLTPMKRRDMALGKIISLILLSGVSATIYIVVMIIGAPLMFGESEFSGLSISMSFAQVVGLIVLLLSMVFLYVAIISLASILAKNVRTASSYISPIYILIIVIGLISMLGGIDKPSLWMYLIPFYGNSLCITGIMSNSISILEYGCNLAETILFSILLLAGVAKAFDSEKIMFNA